MSPIKPAKATPLIDSHQSLLTLPSEPDAEADAAMLHFDLQGQARFTASDGNHHTLSGKAAALAALAALEPKITRRRAALLLWPDSPETQARNNLRTLVHRINKQLGQEVLVGAEQLAISAEHVLVRFAQAAQILAALAAGGPRNCELLAEVGLQELEEFQNWLSGARLRVRQLQLVELDQALARALEHADSTLAIALARACVLLEPLSERWHRKLMHTLTACGDRAAALTAYEDCKATLRENLGAMPDERTRSLHVRILQNHGGTVATSPDRLVLPGATPASGPPDGMPLLVEREAPLAQMEQAWAQGLHLVVRGEAGVGKTRLVNHFIEGKAAEHVTIRAGASEEPYAALAQVLQEVQQRHALPVGRSERIELARAAPAAFPGVELSVASLSVSRLRSALRHWASLLSQAGVRLLVLDDLHCADAPSQVALAGLIAASDEAPHGLQLLLSHRSAELVAVLADAITAEQVRMALTVVPLERLSLQGIEALLVSIGDESRLAQQSASQLLQTTGGNPLFVIELALFDRDQTDGRFGPVGTNLEALLQSRLGGCSEAAQQLAYVAGVALGDFSVEIAAAVTANSALDLMPAWTELQQRGLFGESGLAHDLVRDAVLAALPKAIGKALHRQVALFLESSGHVGAKVLGHWLAADAADRAVPHALRQLHLGRAAGANNLAAEITLIAVIERLSDSALLQHMWTLAATNLADLPPEHFPRVASLTARMERLAKSDDHLAAVAFHKSHLLYYRDKNVRAAYELLASVTHRMPASGTERAHAEFALAFYALRLNGQALLHIENAEAAAVGLPADLGHQQLLRDIAWLRTSISMKPLDLVRSEATRMRAARYRGDVGATKEARIEIAKAFFAAGLSRTALRHFNWGTEAVDDMGEAEPRPYAFAIGTSALACGWFDTAIRCIDDVRDSQFLASKAPYLALIWLRLGRPDLARAHAEHVVEQELHNLFPGYHVNAVVRAGLARLNGADPVPVFEAASLGLKQAGVAGPSFLMLMEWEVTLLTRPASERIAMAARLLETLRAIGAALPRVPRVLLELAEAEAEAGDPQFRAHALEAAGHFRRSRTTITLYLPEALVRCAKLLERSDPAEAASLMHVARRWVVNALPHVPREARESFVADVPVNRQLLSD